jgi:hypothetical protein
MNYSYYTKKYYDLFEIYDDSRESVRPGTVRYVISAGTTGRLRNRDEPPQASSGR